MKSNIRFILLFAFISCLHNYAFNQVCHLVCQDHVNASLRSDSCSRSFAPYDFLLNPDITCTDYKVSLDYPFGTSVLNGTTVNLSHLGYTFIYRVNVGDNGCWGTITIEDKAPPQPICKSGTISCFQFNKINELSKKIIDNCAQEGHSVIESLTWEDYGCTKPDITGRVIRKILSVDKWGNGGRCEDTLLIRKDSFALIKSPDMISLSCLMLCKKKDNTKSAIDPKNFEYFSFSPNKEHSNYPSPEVLIELQTRDTFGSSIRKCIPSNLRVVPFILDSVTSILNGKCIVDDTCIAMYPFKGLLCKLIVNYNDLVFPLCGTGFKIRREWRITNWCTSTDTTIVQYITVEDKIAPIVTSNFKIPFIYNGIAYDAVIPGHRSDITTSAHDCYGYACVDSLKIEDCSKVSQRYSLTYQDGGTTRVKTGNPRECFSLPASPNNQVFLNSLFSITENQEVIKDISMPRNCHIVKYDINDACYNNTYTPIRVINRETGSLMYEFATESAGFALICVTDNTPPNPVCDEVTQTTIDPETCWSRIYATDLDNGSKDNCCNVLHFAVAHMDTVIFYRNKYAKQMEDSCGKADYWKYKEKYDQIIENWINCYVFKDYIDLTECKENQLILRVYEACGIPRYDAHIFKCSPHDWFCYNTYPVFHLWHNYQLKTNTNTYCTTPWPWLCITNHYSKIESLLDDANDYGKPKYPGSVPILLPDIYPYAALCYPEFYFPQLMNNSGFAASFSDLALAPGNTCSARLYSDCMITILIDDKTPPVAEEPIDKFWYCDQVASEEKSFYEMATCNDDIWSPDNAKDKRCVDELGKPYNYIESVKENDSDASDTIDAIKKYYGWYGCNVYGGPHPDEHGEMKSCETSNAWAPLYCRSWLILDKNDAAGKVNPYTKFDIPVLTSGKPKTIASAGFFYIWDNCWIDHTSLDSSDESYFDKCGNGWVKRTWKAKDKCGNMVSVDQKIVTKTRSDFEVLFPSDKVTVCGNAQDLSPDNIGRPMIMDDECELVGINYEDQRFDIVPDACYKIIRTWRIVDWCRFDPNEHIRKQDIIVDDRNVADVIKRPCVYRHVKDNGDGYMSYTQVIIVNDTISPIVTTKDTTFCFYDNSCNVQSIHIPFTAVDNCTDDEFISFRYEIDDNPSASDLAAKRYNKNSIDKFKSDVKSLTSTQKVGTALVHVIAEDNCGNEDTSTFVLIIKDCKKPTPYCYHGIATVLMPSSGEIKVWAKDLNAGSFDNCTPANKLIFTFGPILADSCKLFNCKDIPNGISFTLEVDIYVTDEAGNFDFCKTIINLQDGSGDTCDDAASSSLSLSGGIFTSTESPVELVTLEAKSSNHLPSFKTTANGQYAFTNISLKAPVNVKASRNDAPANGVSTIDILKIQRHLLGIEPITNPYNLIAADINNDKIITATDLIEARRIILNIDNSFSNNQSWRFVPKAFQFNSSSPFVFPETIEIKSLTQDELKRDFVGIKIGDVNNTVTAHSLLGLESRSADQDLEFSINEATLNTGDIVKVAFTGNHAEAQAFQFTLNHASLQLIDIEGGNIQLEKKNFGSFKNYTTLSWNQSNNSSEHILTNQPWFTITFKAQKYLKLSQSISINSRATWTEALIGNTIGGVALKVQNGKSSIQEDRFELYQNTPNPFVQSTLIRFELPQQESALVRITDVMGKELSQLRIDGQKGINNLTVPAHLFTSNGIYYYTLETKNRKETKRMVYIK